jgi:hypothetical protein
MNFDKAAPLATAWVDLVCERQTRIVREATIAKPYGWIFFYQSNDFLDRGTLQRSLLGTLQSSWTETHLNCG